MKLNGPWQNNCMYSFSSSIVRAKRARKKSLYTDCPDVSIGITLSVIRIDGQQQIRTIYQGRIRGIFHRPENAKVSGFFKKCPDRPPPDWKMSWFPDKSGELEALINNYVRDVRRRSPPTATNPPQQTINGDLCRISPRDTDRRTIGRLRPCSAVLGLHWIHEYTTFNKPLYVTSRHEPRGSA